MIKLAILTLSDKASKGERVDESGKAIKDLVEAKGWKVVHQTVLPDDENEIIRKLITLSDSGDVDIILTTGGTGLSPRDVTPEATKAVIDREAPGFSEAIRNLSISKTPYAMLSRAVSGIRGKTLIINLPGSVKGVRESLELLLPVLPHAVEILRGESGGH